MLFLPEENAVNDLPRPAASAASFPPHGPAGKRLVRVGALRREKDRAEHRGQRLVQRDQDLVPVVAKSRHFSSPC